MDKRLNQKEIEKLIKIGLEEDIGLGDITSRSILSPDDINVAEVLTRENIVLCGLNILKSVFLTLDPDIDFSDDTFNDGDNLKNNTKIISIKGKGIALLEGERVALNILQRLCGIATLTKEYVDQANPVKILDTRKTTPLNRIIEKWAVRIGGGENHRFGLYDMIMIKDNHIDFAGGITSVIQKTKRYLSENNKNLDIIVEARNIDEVNEILKTTGVKRILLDNFDYETTKKAVGIIGNTCQTESSGGITEETIIEYAKCGVEFISVGALTHSVINFDLSLKAI